MRLEGRLSFPIESVEAMKRGLIAGGAGWEVDDANVLLATILLNANFAKRVRKALGDSDEDNLGLR